MTVIASPDRRGELAARLNLVRERISAALAAANRGPRDARLIVVTKFHPASDVLALAELGVRDVGENRDQEAAAKQAEVSAMLARQGDQAAPAGAEALSWHFIGQLQSKKVRSVVRYAHSLHSVDRSSLVDALVRALPGQRPEGMTPLRCFIQVDLDEAFARLPAGDQAVVAKTRGGALPAEVPFLAERIAQSEGLSLSGVMAVAPLATDGSRPDPRPAFERLARISELMRREHPSATAISAGMSADLEAALEYGATHLRVGSDVLGPRPYVG